MMTDIDEKTFKALNQLEQAIVDYIDYYNNKRIKVKLKDLVLCNTELNPSLKLFVLTFVVKNNNVFFVEIAKKSNLSFCR